MTEEKIRKKLVFHGYVQGVGFRYVSARKARELGLTGWVRNEYDGSVMMEVQGPETKIDMLLMYLMNDRYIDISHMEARTLEVYEKEGGFGILR